MINVNEPIWITPAEIEKRVNLIACKILFLFICVPLLDMERYIRKTNMIYKYSRWGVILQVLF